MMSTNALPVSREEQTGDAEDEGDKPNAGFTLGSCHQALVAKEIHRANLVSRTPPRQKLLTVVIGRASAHTYTSSNV